MTQSTLWAGIAELERLPGTTLLERLPGTTLLERGRRIVLTPVGERVAQRTRIVHTQAGGLVETAHAGERPLAGALRLGAIPTIAPFLLPRVLPGMRAL